MNINNFLKYIIVLEGVIYRTGARIIAPASQQHDLTVLVKQNEIKNLIEFSTFYYKNCEVLDLISLITTISRFATCAKVFGRAVPFLYCKFRKR